MEVYLPFRHPPSRAPPVTEVRSTILVSGIQAMRTRGLYARYVEALSAQRRERFTSLVAGIWMPVELALDHYRAADRLGLAPSSIEDIGGEVADRINKSVLSVAVKLSKTAGVTPWAALSLAHRVNDLNWRGSDIGITKVGPTEALYDWVGQPCASIPYFVTSFGGYLRALANLFSTRTYVRLVPDRCSPTTISYRLSWA